MPERSGLHQQQLNNSQFTNDRREMMGIRLRHYQAEGTFTGERLASGGWLIQTPEGGLCMFDDREKERCFDEIDGRPGGFMQEPDTHPVREAFDRVVNPKPGLDHLVDLKKARDAAAPEYVAPRDVRANPDYPYYFNMTTSCHGEPKPTGANKESSTQEERIKEWNEMCDRLDLSKIIGDRVAGMTATEEEEQRRSDWDKVSSEIDLSQYIRQPAAAKCATEAEAVAEENAQVDAALVGLTGMIEDLLDRSTAKPPTVTDFIESNAIPYTEGTVIALVAGHLSNRKGKQDVEKAIHLLRQILHSRY